MKDYKLSEIKAICEKHPICCDCPFCNLIGSTIFCDFADGMAPVNWQIDDEEQDDE